jgi:uncharacterized protein YceK
MRSFIVLCVILSVSGCSGIIGKDEASLEFDREAHANDIRVREDRARTHLRALESAVADYIKTEKKIPAKLEKLIPKYISEIPSLDIPACGPESDRVQYYASNIMRDGVVDGTRILATGRWGYVYNENRVIVFVDCVKVSGKGIAWFRERGVY